MDSQRKELEALIEGTAHHMGAEFSRRCIDKLDKFEKAVDSRTRAMILGGSEYIGDGYYMVKGENLGAEEKS